MHFIRILILIIYHAKGTLAGGFAFGGAEVQAKLLEAEGVEVSDNKVDLKVYQWDDLNEELF